MATPGQIHDPRHKDLAWRKGVDKQLRESSRTSQLVVPYAWPASPFGGNGPPTGYWYIPVVAAAFNSVAQNTIPWVIQLDRVVHRAVQLSVPWATDSGTTGEMRLAIINPPAPNSPTQVRTLAAASSGVEQFNWLHGLEPYASGFDVWLQIEARRTGGAGNVNIGYPQGGAIQADPTGAETTG